MSSNLGCRLARPHGNVCVDEVVENAKSVHALSKYTATTKVAGFSWTNYNSRLHSIKAKVNVLEYKFEFKLCVLSYLSMKQRTALAGTVSHNNTTSQSLLGI